MSSLNDDSLDSFMRRVARTPEVDFPRRIDIGMCLAQRFELECELGTGGMGRVFRAYDQVRRSQVALKVVGRLSPGAILQLKREFRAVAELVHPNVVRLHELFSDGPEWFFTMDWVDGVSLDRLPLEVGSPLFRSIFHQLGKALLALHGVGMIHSDLKPSNFLITHGEHRVVLIDFGLARPIGATPLGKVAGTPRYMAPEQAMGTALTEAADWYAFGVVLREALARRRWRAIGAVEPTGEREARELDALCQSLGRLNPRERPRASQILQALGVSDADARTELSAAEADVFVGREHELRVLEQALEQTRSGTPALVVIDGPSGIGKTAIVKHFTKLVRHGGGTVLAGKCRERESMSYKAVDGLIDGILSLLEDLPVEAARAFVPEGVGDLAVLFPALRSARVVAELGASASVGDEREVRDRAIAAFGQLLARLRQHGPLVLSIDDLQWGDAESALLLAPALSGPHAVPLLFVASCRSSASGRGPLLDALLAPGGGQPASVHLTLGPLESHYAEELARACLPGGVAANNATARGIGRDAGGHPLFITELAHSLSASSAPRDAAPVSTLFQLVSKRIATLSAEQRSLLQLLAVAGTPLSRGLLCAASGVDASSAEAALDVLKAQRLARSQGLKQQDAVEIHHDRIREIALAGVVDGPRRSVHLQLARALEASDHKPEQIALHYEEGGEATVASRYWLAAGEQAGRALAFDQAVALYDRGLAASNLSDSELRHVRVRRAHALANAGQGLQAADGYSSVAREQESAEALELQRLASEQLLLSGHLTRGFRTMEQVLRSFGLSSPPGRRMALAALIWGRVRIRARGLSYTLRSEAELTRAELTRLDAAWCISATLGALDPIRGASFQTKHLLLALKAGEPRRLLRALALEAPYTATAGMKAGERTRELFALAEGLAAATNDASAMGLLCLVRGIASYLQGKVHDAVQEFEAALAVLTTRCTGVIWEIVTARRFMIASLFFLGRFRRLNEIVPPLLQDAEARGNLYAMMSFRSAYAWAGLLARDEVDAAREQLRRVREEWEATAFHLSHWNVIVGETYVDLYSGDVEAACARAAEQRAKVRSAGIGRIAVVHTQMWQLSGASAVGCAELLHRTGDQRGVRRSCRAARRAIAQLEKNRIPRSEPFRLLIQAAVNALEGDRAASSSCLELAVAGFDAQHMSLFAAAARVRLAAMLSGSRAQQLADEARQAFDAETVADPVRLTAMLAPGFATAPLAAK